MKVLFTGAAGFIGSALFLRLLERGDTVIGIDNHNHNHNHNHNDYYDPALKKARLARNATHPNYKADSIKVAEAAKFIENTQRDLNIALINELALIFNKMGIDTEAVLKAARSKWNFLPFRPGLVGGHCIGVDS